MWVISLLLTILGCVFIVKMDKRNERRKEKMSYYFPDVHFRRSVFNKKEDNQ